MLPHFRYNVNKKVIFGRREVGLLPIYREELYNFDYSFFIIYNSRRSCLKINFFKILMKYGIKRVKFYMKKKKR